MKTSLVLYHPDALEKYPYLHYIYDAIVDRYSARGGCSSIGFQEASFQKLATATGSFGLLLVKLPTAGSLKKSLWEKLNYPALVRQLQPENIFYLGDHLPILKDAKGARQWSFVADLRKSELPTGAKSAFVKRRKEYVSRLLLTDKIVCYSPQAAEAIKTSLPELGPKLSSWVPLPDGRYLDPSLYSEQMADLFKQDSTNDEAYFLIDARAGDEALVIELLKAFSHFKKWQRSLMQLGLLIAPSLHQDADFMEKVDTYYYRKDVHLITALDTEGLYRWVSHAYAVITPYSFDQGLDLQLAAARLGTLIIAPSSPTTDLLLPGALFNLAALDKDALGQVLISSYKSEILRARHIRAGAEAADAWVHYKQPAY